MYLVKVTIDRKKSITFLPCFRHGGKLFIYFSCKGDLSK